MSRRCSNLSDPAWVPVLSRLYAAALWLYPRDHRRRWGESMQQVFRDRCHEAVHAGRGPWQVVFADLLPDLAASASRERITSIQELPPMQRMRLVVLLFALMGTLVFRTQLGDSMWNTHQWWTQWQKAHYQQTIDDHLNALAQAAERNHGGISDDIAAAQLYQWAADRKEWWRRDSDSSQGDPRTATALNALRDHANVAFARALKSDARVALWLAVTGCPAHPKVCKEESSLARLLHIDANNGAVWLAEMNAAHVAHDSVRERTALARLARASNYDTHYGDLMRAMLVAFDRQPLPARLMDDVIDPSAASEQEAQAQRVRYTQVFMRAPWLLLYNGLHSYCHGKDAQINDERADDCRAAGRLMAQSGGMWVERSIGFGLWLRHAQPTELEDVRERIRTAHWDYVAPGYHGVQESARNWIEWKAAWMAGGSEIDVMSRLLRLYGIPPRPPETFRSDAMLLNNVN